MKYHCNLAIACPATSIVQHFSDLLLEFLDSVSYRGLSWSLATDKPNVKAEYLETFIWFDKLHLRTLIIFCNLPFQFSGKV